MQNMPDTTPAAPGAATRAGLAGAALPLQAGGARVATLLRSSNSGLLLLALAVGAGAGVGAIMFRWLIKTFTLILSGHADYSAAGHAANPHAARARAAGSSSLAPVVAGLLYGPLVHFFAREARGHGVPEVMYAVARRGGRIAPQVAAVKALASALCIGGGGSVGREGRSCRSAPRSARPSAGSSGWPSRGCGCWSPAAPPAASPPPSTPRWPACSSRWS